MSHREPPAKLSPLIDDGSMDRFIEVFERRRAAQGSKSSYPRNDMLWKVGQLILAAVLAYGVADRRIAVLESRVNDMKADIGTIMQDVKELLGRR